MCASLKIVNRPAGSKQARLGPGFNGPGQAYWPSNTADKRAHHIIIITGFGIYGAAVLPDSGVGNTWQRLTLVLHEFLSNGLVISFLTHADHVFLGLPRSLVPGSHKRVMELMHEVARM